MDPNSKFWFGLDWFNGFASILPPLTIADFQKHIHKLDMQRYVTALKEELLCSLGLERKPIWKKSANHLLI